MLLVEATKCTSNPQQNVVSVATAIKSDLIREEVGLRILNLLLSSGELRTTAGEVMSLDQVEAGRFLNPSALNKLRSQLQQRELIDPNTAEKLNLCELRQRCVPDDETGLLLLPVKQQPGGTVCLKSGKKVGIFRAVQEGLIDRTVTARLLEAQLFAGGIADPRSGHRLTIDEALCHGLMDQEMACAMLARQLQNGGIIDPVSGERLDLEESICRGLLSSRLALVVLESLWVFMGVLWPESGELLPIVEALQQGLISTEFSRKILKQRHAIGALYNPETLEILPLNQTSDVHLEPSVIGFLRDAYIPDMISNMNCSSLNHLSWSSKSSAPSLLSAASSTSSQNDTWFGKPTHETDPKEQEENRLLFHLATKSYVDAHSGKRLVLLDSELTGILKTTEMAPSLNAVQTKQQTGLTRDRKESLIVEDQFSSTEKELSDGPPDTENRMLENTEVIAYDRSYESAKGKNEKEENLRVSSVDNIVDGFPKNPNELEETKPKSSNVQQKKNVQNVVLLCPEKVCPTELNFSDSDSSLKAAQFNSRGENISVEESFLSKIETNDFKAAQPSSSMDTKYISHESESNQQKLPITNSAETPPQTKSTGINEENDSDVARLVLELKQGGLLSDDGERLLPDEAVAQGVIPGHIAVRVMAEAKLFGGFLNANSVETLGMEDVLKEGITDEDLMWNVLKSDKSLSGIVDAEKRKILSVREAAEKGLIDFNTSSRLLEGQVASGGIVDLCRNKKVSVASAANLGLVDEAQTVELMALEQAYKGKDSDSAAALTVATLQLQMEGLVDPQSKSPISLEQAIQKGILKSEGALQVLAQQVAEGGIIHHASGIRLSVRDAVGRGLVDRSISSRLEELEWACKGKVSPSSHPEALILQALTGAVLDPDSGCKLTLAEAVSKGFLTEDVASGAMVSSAVTKAVLDPQTAQIVPFSELVKQGKIDVETGKRFLEVKPFKGIQSDKTNKSMTLPEAVESKKVDPIPALRLLQSQADTGGIVDINTGERLPLFEACDRGLIEEKMIKALSINQNLKESLIIPNTQNLTLDLQETNATTLFSDEIPSDLQKNISTNEVSIAAEPLLNETYNTSATPLGVSADLNIQAPLRLQKTELPASTSINGNPSYAFSGKVKKVSHNEVPLNQDQLVDISSVEKEPQKPVETTEPQADLRADSPSLRKLNGGLQKKESETNYEQTKNTDSAESSQLPIDVTNNDSGEKNVFGDFNLNKKFIKSNEGKSNPGKESTRVGNSDSDTRDQTDVNCSFSRSSDTDHKEGEVSAEPSDADQVNEEKPLLFDVKRSEPLLLFPPRLTQSKTKRRKKSKKNGKDNADEGLQPQDIKHIYAEVNSQEHSAVDKELEAQQNQEEALTYGQAEFSLPLDGEAMKEQLVFEKSERISSEIEEDTVKSVPVNEIQNNGKKLEEIKRKEQKGKVQLMASVSELTKQTPGSHKIEKVMEQDLPQRGNLVESEKAELVLKAKAKELKKGVNDEQVVKERKALRSKVSKHNKITVDQPAVIEMENNSKTLEGVPKDIENNMSAESDKDTTTAKVDSTLLNVKTQEMIGKETNTTALKGQAKETPAKAKKKNKKKEQSTTTSDNKVTGLTKEEITTNSDEVAAELQKPTSVLEGNIESASDVGPSHLCAETESFKEPEGEPPFIDVVEQQVPHSDAGRPQAKVLSLTSQECHESTKPEIIATEKPITVDAQSGEGAVENEKKHKSPAADVANLSESKPPKDTQQSTDSVESLTSVSKSMMTERAAASENMEQEGTFAERALNQEEKTYTTGQVGSNKYFCKGSIQFCSCFIIFIVVILFFSPSP